MVKGESKGWSVFMASGMWPQVAGTESHEPSGCMPFVERQFADAFLIYLIPPTRTWEKANPQP